MSKRYRLKKDLPDCKAGTILTQDDSGLDYDYIAYGGVESFYHQNQVEGNVDWFELIEEPKEWEIIKSHYMRGFESDRCFVIDSVKRLSDNEVFTVGDEVGWDLIKLPGQTHNSFIIKSFEINEIIRPARMFCNNQNIDICNLSKKQKPKEVFTWDDKLACEWAGYLEEVLKIGTSTSQIPAILRMWKERHKSKTKPLPKDVFEVKAVFCRQRLCD